MCQFFSFVSDGKGKMYYFDWEQRKQIMEGKIKVQSADSHTSIADFYGFKGALEDQLNKYEYHPLTKVFKVDQLNTTDDSKDVEKIVSAWDFKTIIEPLIIKPIVHPFKDRKTKKVTKKDKEWAYLSTLFNIKYKFDFSSVEKLWERGLVASFDGTYWRLHGHEGKVLWKGKLKGDTP